MSEVKTPRGWGRAAIIAAALGAVVVGCSSGSKSAPVAEGYDGVSTCDDLSAAFATNLTKDVTGSNQSDTFDTKMFTHLNSVSQQVATKRLTCDPTQFLAIADSKFGSDLRQAAVASGQVSGRKPASYDEWKTMTLTPILVRVFSTPPPTR